MSPDNGSVHAITIQNIRFWAIWAWFRLDQIQNLLHLEWKRGLTFYLAALIAYFSLVQAPDLYETLYWRAGMTSL